MINLEKAADQLYVSSLDAFVSERARLVKELRAADRREDAATLAKSRKPSVAAWVLNQLARRDRRDVDSLLDAGHRLREAQARALSGHDREAFERAQKTQIDALRRLTAAAGRLLTDERAGAAASVLNQVEEGLRAAAISETGREMLARGRFVDPPQAEGFEVVGQVAGTAPTRPRRKRAAKEVERRLLVTAVVTALTGIALASGASAAQLIDRNATGVQIAVNAKGEALLTYRKAGAVKHVLVWGAVNALPSTAGSTGSRQVKFLLDYAGGWGKYRTLYWKTFRGSCGTYDGPALPDVVAACKAPDGSYWAAQSWPQPLPDLGYTPWNDAGRADWLEVSHWTGPVAQTETGMDWVYNGRFQDLFGRYTYRGMPVYGYGTTRYGAPTDGFGALIYLDTYDSVYGPGWRRENSFVSHNPTGAFCYGFYPFDPTKGGYAHPPGQTTIRGPERARSTASSPKAPE